MSQSDLRARTAANRVRIADLFDATPAHRLSDPSLCAGWDLRTLLGHVVMPVVTPLPRLLLEAVRRRSMDRASTAIAEDLGRRPLAELTTLLRLRAARVTPAPGVGPLGQFADGCIHLRDAARPLAADVDVPQDDWATVLAWLPTRAAGLGHVPCGLLDGLYWSAPQVSWSYGEGPDIVGRPEAVALAMTGRAVVLPELRGSGVDELASRLAARAGRPDPDARRGRDHA